MRKMVKKKGIGKGNRNVKQIVIIREVKVLVTNNLQ